MLPVETIVDPFLSLLEEVQILALLNA